MTFVNLYVLIILIVYLSAFFLQNLRTFFSIRQSIRGRSGKLSLSLGLSTVIYVLTFIQLAIGGASDYLGFIRLLDVQALQISGAIMTTIALFTGLAALYEMKNSWRVGIKYDQKTELITTGIYRMSRNPYFLSYNLLFTGIFLIFPSLVLLTLIISLMVTFHFMILEEERYLTKVQGEGYLTYKLKTGRYLFGF
jgi:protein-S-isoprenylcysteine O-methyltransferase Ste14